MKKITVKRLVYHDGQGNFILGGYEYDGALTDANILGAVHEVGKTRWIGNELWLMRHGCPLYRITVESFTQYQKTWFGLLMDAVRRI